MRHAPGNSNEIPWKERDGRRPRREGSFGSCARYKIFFYVARIFKENILYTESIFFEGLEFLSNVGAKERV